MAMLGFSALARIAMGGVLVASLSGCLTNGAIPTRFQESGFSENGFAPSPVVSESQDLAPEAASDDQARVRPAVAASTNDRPNMSRPAVPASFWPQERLSLALFSGRVVSTEEKDLLNRPLRLASLQGSGGTAKAQGEAAEEQDMDEIGRKLANPVSDVWAMFTEFDLGFNNGDAVRGDSNKTNFSVLFQPIMPINLNDEYRLITRPTLPIVLSQAVPERNGLGGFDRKTGLGDTQLPMMLAPKAPYEFAGGQIVGALGPTFQFPTATDSRLGTKTWEIGPAGVLVYKTKEITAGVFPQYFWSYADRDGDQSNTSHGQLLYFFFYNLPDAWQVGFNPTITYDDRAGSGDKWNVPIGLTVAKTTKIGNTPVKFQFGIEYSAWNEDTYGREVLFKFNIIPVIKPLFGG